MKRQELRMGMRVRLLGQEYSIKQRLPHGQVLLRHVVSGTSSVKSEREIFKAISRGDGNWLGTTYDKDKDRHGKRVADLRQRVNRLGVSPTFPWERVQTDDTKLDLFVIDEKTNSPIGRPWLVIDICSYTKMILGFHLSSSKPHPRITH